MVLRRWGLVAAVVLLAACARVRVREHFVPPPGTDPACAAFLLATGNNQYLEQSFELPDDALVRVVGQGEGASFSLTPGLIESFHNDCVEFFIDLGDFNRQYRFVWGDRKVEGKYADMEGVVFAQGDPSDTDYLFEVAFPWRTLGFKSVPDAIRMDISVCDNDDESRKSQMARSGIDGNLWNDPSQYGDVLLHTAPSQPGSDFSAHACRTATVPVIDGAADMVWDLCGRVEVTHLQIGTTSGPEDLSAWFRVLYDDSFLYLLVEVHDNVKRQAAFLFDNGSIVDASGSEVWRMTIDRTEHAGGALKNRRQEDTLRLSAGRYTLFYSTDESHSAGHWDDTPPDDPFSGIKLYTLGL